MTALAGAPNRHLLATDFVAFAPTTTLTAAARKAVREFQQDFPVVGVGRLVGMLDYRALLAGIVERDADALVGAATTRDLPAAMFVEALPEFLERLADSGLRTIPVVDAGRLAGLVSMDNVRDWALFRSAVGQPGAEPIRDQRRSGRRGEPTSHGIAAHAASRQ